ncbi:MAG: hypothetical protein Q9170_001976 [Blastenia crenularia]
MSWASDRQTTRPEDEAYCLMGIFDVNMPLLYGEGRKAFKRLQHEVARTSDDESLFAWHTTDLWSGIFASDPRDFAGCGNFLPIPNLEDESEIADEAFNITNRGLRMAASLRKIFLPPAIGPGQIEQKEYLLLPLRCARKGSENMPFTVILSRISRGQYVRFVPGEIMVYERFFPRENVEIFNRIIYIQEPDSSGPLRGMWDWLRNEEVKLHHATNRGYQLTEWYASPSGDVLCSPTGEWSVHFKPWPGFVVLKFKDAAEPFLYVVLKKIPDPSLKSFVRLHFVAVTTNDMHAVVEACYDKVDLLQPALEGPIINCLAHESGTTVALAQVTEGDTDRIYSLSVFKR